MNFFGRNGYEMFNDMVDNDGIYKRVYIKCNKKRKIVDVINIEFRKCNIKGNV